MQNCRAQSIQKEIKPPKGMHLDSWTTNPYRTCIHKTTTTSSHQNHVFEFLFLFSLVCFGLVGIFWGKTKAKIQLYPTSTAHQFPEAHYRPIPPDQRSSAFEIWMEQVCFCRNFHLPLANVSEQKRLLSGPWPMFLVLWCLIVGLRIIAKDPETMRTT